MSPTTPLQRPAELPAPAFSVPSWVRPIVVPNGRHPVAGGWAAFDQIDLVQRDEAGAYTALRMEPDQLFKTAGDRNAAAAVFDLITAPRAPFAGLVMDRPQIMGILNVTPDSFSDGGRHDAPGRAVASGREMIAAGATIIDIGGESTRPGAEAVTRNQELARVLPPIAGLKPENAVISIDTRHGEVMSRATTAGAGIINDVGGLRGEGALDAAAAANVPVIIMHMQGTPETMQNDPQYGFAPVEIMEFLSARIEASILADRNSMISTGANPYWGSFCIVSGVPCICMMITGTFAAAAASSAPSPRRPPTSLMIPAPAVVARLITSPCRVSMEITAFSGFRPAIGGSTRASS